MPDFGYELSVGGAQLADRTAMGERRLAEWRRDVARGWNRRHSGLFDLYTRLYVSAFFGAAADSERLAVHSKRGLVY